MKTLARTSASAAILLTTVAGCATQPDKIQGNYVSPSTYSSYSCKAIISERNNIVNKLNEMNSGQKKKASNDAIATGVALVLFWPAAFFVAAGNDMEPQIASLKGNYDALTSAGHQKGCF